MSGELPSPKMSASPAGETHQWPGEPAEGPGRLSVVASANPWRHAVDICLGECLGRTYVILM